MCTVVKVFFSILHHFLQYAVKESIMEILQSVWGSSILWLVHSCVEESIVRKWTEISWSINCPCEQPALRPQGEGYCWVCSSVKVMDTYGGQGYEWLRMVYFLLTWPLLIITGTFEHGSTAFSNIFATFIMQSIRQRGFGILSTHHIQADSC